MLHPPHVATPDRPLIVTDPKIRKMLQLAGLRFMCSRARWLDSEATRIWQFLKAGTMTSDEVDAELEEMGALDLVYPELMGASRMKHESQFSADIPPPDLDDPFPHTHPGTDELRYRFHLEEQERKKAREVPVRLQADREEWGSGFPYLEPFEFFGADDHQKMWIIKGIIARGETSAWIAPPGGMKSALMAELSLCSSYGQDWHGFQSKATLGVVYFALERADLVRRRLRAHLERIGNIGNPAISLRLP